MHETYKMKKEFWKLKYNLQKIGKQCNIYCKIWLVSFWPNLEKKSFEWIKLDAIDYNFRSDNIKDFSAVQK